MNRKLKEQIIKDLESKIVFLTGPRQVGKAWLGNTDLLVLEEIHKVPGWKTYVKGIFDTKPEKLKILVTGSARLDCLRRIHSTLRQIPYQNTNPWVGEYFRQTGESLSGRFFSHRLYPLSPGELAAAGAAPDLD